MSLLANGNAAARALFAARAAGLADLLAASAGTRWALVCRDAENFALGLLALLAAGKDVVLPQAARPASIDGAGADRLLSDVPELAVFDPLDPAVARAANKAIGIHDIPASARLELHTSGSTGEVKVVSKRFGQLVDEVRALESLWGARTKGAPVFSTVPHYHLYGLLFRILWPLWSERPFARTASLHPFELTSAAQPQQRCVIVSSPAFLSRLDHQDDLPPPARVAALFSSGAPLPADTAAWLADTYGVAATEVFGSTETGGIAWREYVAEDQRWTLVPGVEVKGGGRLKVRSPWIGADGWFVADDRGVIDADGRLTLLGRTDSVIKFEDKRISLDELAARLRAHPCVADVRLLLVPGARTRLGAVVVPAAGVDVSGAAARRELGRQLGTALQAYYETLLIPRKWRYVSEFPVNSMGKVTNAALLELFGVPQ